MSQPIPTSHKPRSLSITHAQIDSNSALLTPNGTPPHTAGHEHNGHFESKLQKLLSNFESGTHSFDRAERETPEERRMSFGSDIFPTPPSSRRPSFLTSLGISRPFAFTPTTSSPISSTPTTISGSQLNDNKEKEFHSIISRPNLENEFNSKSTPNIPHYYNNNEKEEKGNLPISINRSKTTSQINQQTKKQNGFINQKEINHNNIMISNGDKINPNEKRHFDPSREPKLLGLL
ncbi:uncharacterized protein I206_103526 [Kwoniella pini CBS 10737]|uniref:Uncharacterized protein n=1 Tax=Kwoniella pini CBS 10737 TaxID=1296096 RepID=A0A1B9I9H3_9TREE|nr:uncharacterized protein I206_01470 [Kwoniella pini CBS 10737]OCF52185.1 hypothetical protein I206_01470 [Kwoniella pini CBS 10737]